MDDLRTRIDAPGLRGPYAISRRSLLAGSLAAGASLLASGAPAVIWSRLAAGERTTGFSEVTRAFVDAFCDTFIPDTDTPGAKSAGVPQFIELLITSTPHALAVTEFEANIVLISRDLEERGRAPFVRLAPPQRETILAPFDHAAITATSERPYYGTYVSLRVLTVLGYYTSSEGASEELRYEPVPGRYDADIPMDPAARAFSNTNV
jgi:gluconate 2-dehydrogenase gamma chain